MKRKATIRVRQLSAILLLAVFLFIHLLKAFHSHEASSLVSKHNAIQVVKAADDCSVCDYQYAKDADDVSVLPAVESSPAYASYLIFFPVKRTSSIGLYYSDRGPPAQG